MIKSMTGYGSAEITENGRKISVEIKSVNHRYKDLNVRVPRNYGYLEDVVRTEISSFLQRGKTDVYVSMEQVEGENYEVSVNTQVAKGYYKALETIKNELDLKDNISLTNIIKFSDIFNIQKPDENDEEIVALAKKVICEAGKSFTEMRSKEGEKLYEDLLCGLCDIENLLSKIEERAPSIVEEYSVRLRERMQEILDETTVDEGRLLNEVAIFSDRVNINEEIIRLKSHFAQMREMIASNEPVGRKLDFLIQEMNRETNTIGSKSNDLDVAKIVIDIKSGIEKLREQVQNVE